MKLNQSIDIGGSSGSLLKTCDQANINKLTNTSIKLPSLNDSTVNLLARNDPARSPNHSPLPDRENDYSPTRFISPKNIKNVMTSPISEHSRNSSIRIRTEAKRSLNELSKSVVVPR